jgi:hypothetical protein
MEQRYRRDPPGRVRIPDVMTLVDAIRDRVLDAELAALLWLLVEGGVPAHVASPDAVPGASLAAALRGLARDPAAVSSGPGSALEDVLRQPVPLRPASGAVVVLGEGRVVAAHAQRPPLRDAGGHVRPQGPAVLATWDPAEGAWEHFAWGVIPELAEATHRRAGDFEIEQGRRREYLEQLVASPLAEPGELAQALRGYGVRSGPA